MAYSGLENILCLEIRVFLLFVIIHMSSCQYPFLFKKLYMTEHYSSILYKHTSIVCTRKYRSKILADFHL